MSPGANAPLEPQQATAQHTKRVLALGKPGVTPGTHRDGSPSASVAMDKPRSQMGEQTAVGTHRTKLTPLWTATRAANPEQGTASRKTTAAGPRSRLNGEPRRNQDKSQVPPAREGGESAVGRRRHSCGIQDPPGQLCPSRGGQSHPQRRARVKQAEP